MRTLDIKLHAEVVKPSVDLSVVYDLLRVGANINSLVSADESAFESLISSKSFRFEGDMVRYSEQTPHMRRLIEEYGADPTTHYNFMDRMTNISTNVSLNTWLYITEKYVEMLIRKCKTVKKFGEYLEPLDKAINLVSSCSVDADYVMSAAHIIDMLRSINLGGFFGSMVLMGKLNRFDEILDILKSGKGLLDGSFQRSLIPCIFYNNSLSNRDGVRSKSEHRSQRELIFYVSRHGQESQVSGVKGMRWYPSYGGLAHFLISSDMDKEYKEDLHYMLDRFPIVDQGLLHWAVTESSPYIHDIYERLPEAIDYVDVDGVSVLQAAPSEKVRNVVSGIIMEMNSSAIGDETDECILASI